MKHTYLLAGLLTSTAFMLAACGGGGGGSSSFVPPTVVAPTPPVPLVSVSRSADLAAGDADCFRGGTRTDSGLDDNRDGTLDDGEVDSTTFDCTVTQANEIENFRRIATFPVCLQQDANCDTNVIRRAEILDVSTDGNTLIYTDAPRETLGFVDITNPQDPQPAGSRDLPGVPTSLAVKGDFAIVTLDRADSSGPSNGSLEIVNLNTRSVVRSIALAGNPDSVAVSPDGTRALVAVENPNLNGSDQPPTPGFLVGLDISNDDPSEWTTTNIALTGLADIAADDPEPEFVDINSDNVAVVSLQTNNHFVIVDLATNTVTADFSAGRVDIDQVDALEGGIDVINQSQRLVGVLREPDGVAWINTSSFVSANEGAQDGGSRGFSVFDVDGTVSFDSGNALEHEAARLGHYPENRSEDRGNEPEGAEVGVYGADRYAFIGAERGDLIYVYDVADPSAPLAVQSLPTPSSPEGIKAIPSRNLLVVAGEQDDRPDSIRSAISLYAYEIAAPTYPTLRAENRADGTPIPWGALSGLSVDPQNDTVLYSVEDGVYDSNRIFRIDLSSTPARLTDEIRLRDDNDVIANLTISGDSRDRNRFDGRDRADLLNADGTVNLDLEGITRLITDNFWVVAEGKGDSTNTIFEPIDSVNLLLRVEATGIIEEAIRLPANIEATQEDRGFAGVVEKDGVVYVPFQRPWDGESGHRIGRFNLTTQQWDFIFYQSDAPESQNGGRVSLTAISETPDGGFWLLESDSEGGLDSAVKRIYAADLTSVAANGTVSKVLAKDLLAAGDLPAGAGQTPNNLEALTVLSDGSAYIVNDNDGLSRNLGETRLIKIE